MNNSFGLWGNKPFSQKDLLSHVMNMKDHLPVFGSSRENFYSHILNKEINSRDHTHHLTSSSMVFDYTFSNVLMIHHKKYNEWLYPGGHNDGDWLPLRVALKECLEETALDDIQVIPPTWAQHVQAQPLMCPHFVQYFPVPAMPKAQAHYHIDFLFTFKANGPIPNIQSNTESLGIRWFPIEKMSKQFSSMHVFDNGISLDTCAMCLKIYQSLSLPKSVTYPSVF